MESETTNLTGHLLIAMPAMLDPNFSRSVIYICEHNDQGSLGLVVNRPMDMELGTVFQQLSLTVTDPSAARAPILAGGPVSLERGFVIHDACPDWESTIEAGDSLFVTTSKDILTAIAVGHGPTHALLALGYAGWGAGQLEQELSANAWLSVPASPEIIFDTPFEQRWQKAAGLLGIDLTMISNQTGHA